MSDMLNAIAFWTVLCVVGFLLSVVGALLLACWMMVIRHWVVPALLRSRDEPLDGMEDV